MDENRTQELREIEQVVGLTLDEGLDDWIPVESLIWSVCQAVAGDSNRFAELLASVLDCLLREELMIIGEIGDTGFEPWPATAIEGFVERVVRDCRTGNGYSRLSLCWLVNTINGDQQAQRVRDSRI